MDPNNQIQLVEQTADHEGFSLAINSLTGSLYEAARANIELTTDGGNFSALQMRSMIVTEQLRLVGGMDLASLLIRGQLIRQIAEEGLHSVHPNGYADLSALAADQGVSVGELSDVRALCEYIFPYITNVLQRNLHEVWSEVGKSKFREMVPALKSLITGEEADAQTVRDAVAAMLSNSTLALMQDNVIDEDTPDEEARLATQRHAVESLLHFGATLPVRELRRTVRPARTPPVEALTLQVADYEWFQVLHITTQEQYDMVQRVLGIHQNNMLLNGRDDQTRVRMLRRMFPGGARE